MTRWLDQGFTERILPFDSAAAQAYAEIAAIPNRSGAGFLVGGTAMPGDPHDCAAPTKHPCASPL